MNGQIIPPHEIRLANVFFFFIRGTVGLTCIYMSVHALALQTYMRRRRASISGLTEGIYHLVVSTLPALAMINSPQGRKTDCLFLIGRSESLSRVREEGGDLDGCRV